jgi:hypothetical protein
MLFRHLPSALSIKSKKTSSFGFDLIGQLEAWRRDQRAHRGAADVGKVRIAGARLEVKLTYALFRVTFLALSAAPGESRSARGPNEATKTRPIAR